MGLGKDLYTASYICVLLQTPYGRVQRTIEALGVKPLHTINGIPHYTETDFDKIKAELGIEPASTIKTTSVKTSTVKTMSRKLEGEQTSGQASVKRMTRRIEHRKFG